MPIARSVGAHCRSNPGVTDNSIALELGRAVLVPRAGNGLQLQGEHSRRVRTTPCAPERSPSASPREAHGILRVARRVTVHIFLRRGRGCFARLPVQGVLAQSGLCSLHAAPGAPGDVYLQLRQASAVRLQAGHGAQGEPCRPAPRRLRRRLPLGAGR